MSDNEEKAVQGDGRKERKSILLRLDPAVHEALAKWAADDLRSLNAHIEVLLRDALKGQAAR
ncbi:toxin-antitoxin system HicB family antitoxin [Tessaracoccus sp. HDW20]|uniref:toxin-antitoxin system HicB family antitoxin n=1 Tax=Tessaracoccus coleopterorum TaxID=2714950 RepID=UPI001E65277B|nr:toxin-antitoxin system HicB family antitoxin [Tessaracoccus coleopterorum]NHB85380.1 toxin-antitoxin system HicB family antitoxin [Tessaracoccus coleopterorum]